MKPRFEAAVAVTALVGLGLIGERISGTLVAPARQALRLAGYATSLDGRTPAQRFNARRAALALDGSIIAPSAVFSFDKTVRSWTWDQGYRKAPVSYEGELVRAYGGGVCQTSTTLYNAALLAGLPIVERHHHIYAPHYIPAGRDAAVAQYDVDLRFRNPYRRPIQIRAQVSGDRLEIAIYGAAPSPETVQILSETLGVTRPSAFTRTVTSSVDAPASVYVRNPGAAGFRVVTYRIFSRDGREVRRERLSDDSYPAMDRLIQLPNDGAAGRTNTQHQTPNTNGLTQHPDDGDGAVGPDL